MHFTKAQIFDVPITLKVYFLDLKNTICDCCNYYVCMILLCE